MREFLASFYSLKSVISMEKCGFRKFGVSWVNAFWMIFGGHTKNAYFYPETYEGFKNLNNKFRVSINGFGT